MPLFRDEQTIGRHQRAIPCYHGSRILVEERMQESSMVIDLKEEEEEEG